MAVDYVSTLSKNGSGLNIRDLTSTLVMSDIQPKQSAAEKKITSAEVSISALGQVRAQFEKLDSALGAIANNSVLSATSTTSAVGVIVSDRQAISEGTTEISVEQLARRQVLEFTGFDSPDAIIGTGQITVDIGVWTSDVDFVQNPATTPMTIDIGEGATLSDLAEALTSLTGVTARVLDRGDGTYTLGIVSETGAGNALRLTATETAVTPGLSAFDTTTTNATHQIQEAANALLTVDGIAIYRESNSIDDVIPGATLELGGTTGPAAISVARDSATAYEMLGALAQQINETMATLKAVTANGLDGGVKGDLAGDRSIQMLQGKLRSLLSEPIRNFPGGDIFLSDFGLTTQRDGTLSINKFIFDRSFNSNPTKFEAVFSNRLTSSTEGVKVSGLLGPDATTGDYAFAVDANGKAKVGDSPMLAAPLPDGGTQYIALSGSVLGMVVKVPAGVTSADITFGRGFTSSLSNLLADALDGAGALDKREQALTDIVDSQKKVLEDLDTRGTMLEERYLKRFAVMEKAITQLKGTGSYLTNLMAMWTKSN